MTNSAMVRMLMRYLAIAVKLHVDAGKAGVSDDQSERWFKQFNPRFD
jgi:hypothetical protein